MVAKNLTLRAASALSANDRKLLPGSTNVEVLVRPENTSVSIPRNLLTAFCSKARDAVARGELGATFFVDGVVSQAVKDLFKWATKACYESNVPMVSSRESSVDLVSAATTMGMNLDFMQMPAFLRSRLIQKNLVDLFHLKAEADQADCNYLSRFIAQRMSQPAFLDSQAFHTKVEALQKVGRSDHAYRCALEISLGRSQTVKQTTALVTAFGTKRFVWDAVRVTALALKAAHPKNPAGCPELTNAQVTQQARSLVRQELEKL